jgi:hypothetical protein
MIHFKMKKALFREGNDDFIVKAVENLDEK